MPDPTPTPDTLRAAAERAVREFDRPGYMSMPLALMSALDALRAALAASPAPTDSPDERCGECGDALVSAAPYDGWYHADPEVEQVGHEPRPAAVTAPREDEVCAWCQGVKASGRWICEVCTEAPGFAGRWTAAAPAVERTTTDPDTLAALVPHYDWCLNPGDDEWCSCWPVRLTVARALIAAGVTLNETATTTTETTDATQ